MSNQTLAGTKFVLRGVERVIPPINLRQLRELRAEFATLRATQQQVSDSGLLSDEAIAAMQKIVAAALSRNYPGYSVEEAEQDIDLGNLAEIFSAVVGQSGLGKPRTILPPPGTASKP